MLRMNQEEEKNTLINSITRDDPKMRARAFLSRLSQKELEIIDDIVEKARRKKCKRCRELNKAMEMYEGFRWQGYSDYSMYYDRETNEIVIPEEMLMYFVKLANPEQPERRIRLVKLIRDEKSKKGPEE
nr:MAG TPA: hypothetical protein [Caudoviricetes sp.]